MITKNKFNDLIFYKKEDNEFYKKEYEQYVKNINTCCNNLNNTINRKDTHSLISSFVYDYETDFTINITKKTSEQLKKLSNRNNNGILNNIEKEFEDILKKNNITNIKREYFLYVLKSIQLHCKFIIFLTNSFNNRFKVIKMIQTWINSL